MHPVRRTITAAAAVWMAGLIGAAARAAEATAAPDVPDAASAALTLQPQPTTEPAHNALPGTPGGPPAQPVFWTASLYGGWQYTSEFGNADLVLTRFGGDFGAIVPLHQKFIASVNVKAEDSIYDWRNFQHEAPGVKDPIHDALLLRIAPGFEWNVNDKWTLDGGVFLQTAGDPSALGHDATTYGALVSAKYKFSSNLSAGFGLVTYTELKDESSTLPLLVLDWQIDNKWKLTAEDAELRLSYEVDKRTSVYLAGEYQFRQFRLLDSGALKNGSLTDAAIPVRVGVEYAASPSLDLAGEVGVIAYEKITIDDGDNNRVVKDDVNPTVFFGLHANYHF